MQWGLTLPKTYYVCGKGGLHGDPQKRAELASLVKLTAVLIAALLFAATGSFDAGVACAGHVRGVAADVRVDAAEDLDPMLCPVRRRRSSTVGELAKR